MAEPILQRATVVSALSGLTALLVKAGDAHEAAWVQAHQNWIAGAILFVAPSVTALLARRHVVPKASLLREVQQDAKVLQGILVTREGK